MSELKKKLEIQAGDMQFHFDAGAVGEKAFEAIDPCCGIIGQDRALTAMELGLEMKSKGYNIFVTGQPGTGRTTAVKMLVESVPDDDKSPLQDICFVNNFKMPEYPTVLYFPAGDGRKFKKAIAYLIESLVTVIPKIFATDNYKNRRGRIIKAFEARQKDLFKDFEKQITEKGFVLVQLQYGNAIKPDLQPVMNGEPVSLDELEKSSAEGKFPAEDLEKLKVEYEKLSRELEATSVQSKQISVDLESELERLNTSLVVPWINDKIETLKNLYNSEKVGDYLGQLNQVLIDMLELFHNGGPGAEGQVPPDKMRQMFSQFTVNLIVDNGDQEGRPIIIEDFPTFKNLFGSIDRVRDPATGWHTDFTRIRGGSMLRANGGYLVLQAADMFQDPFVWPTLKRTLRTSRLAITNNDALQMTGTGLKPDPIDLDVKVILIGEGRIYNTLFSLDGEFKKIFKVKAEFDNVMENGPDTVAQYTQFIKKITDEEGLFEFDATGLSAVAEYGVKLAGRKDRLSTSFTMIADVVREASWMAKKNSQNVITREIIKKVIRMQRRRVNLIETKIQDMYERDFYLIDVSGWKVGQINGLSVYDLGEYAFGRPARITASLSPGAAGVINIEREAAMSGRTHDKGVLILSGFMRNRFGRKHPLVFTASLCFEQSYGGVDGDSASSTEIYALLSALSDKPINQSLAVTGSVNQKGEIQPIGGVNEKIEGFFDVCMIDGLTGEQGVLIPKQNVPELMLKDEVVDAVRQGTFHVYSIGHVDEGIEILTGIPAGQADADGAFPEGTINHLAAVKLRELGAIWKEYINTQSP